MIFHCSGQAKVVVEPSLHPQQYPHLYPLEDPGELESEDEDELIQVKKKEKERYEERERNLLTLLPSAARRKEKPRVLHEISLIGNNDVIGMV